MANGDAAWAAWKRRLRELEGEPQPANVPAPVEGLGPDTWRVSSASTPGQSYLVQQAGDEYVCDCLAGTVGTPCWHVELVARSAEMYARYRAKTEDK